MLSRQSENIERHPGHTAYLCTMWPERCGRAENLHQDNKSDMRDEGINSLHKIHGRVERLKKGISQLWKRISVTQ